MLECVPFRGDISGTKIWGHSEMGFRGRATTLCPMAIPSQPRPHLLTKAGTQALTSGFWNVLEEAGGWVALGIRRLSWRTEPCGCGAGRFL